MADSTLTTLFPAQPFMVGGDRLMLRPVVLGELPQVERVAEAWRVMVATSGQVLDAEAWEDFLSLLAAAVGQPVAWLESLDEATFERVVCLVLAVNEDVWKPTEDTSEGEAMTWAEILQSLI